MSRDTRIESKFFTFTGSKSSDISYVIDMYRFTSMDGISAHRDGTYDYEMTREQVEGLLDFTRKSGNLKDRNKTVKQIQNIYDRMTPNDTMKVHIF